MSKRPSITRLLSTGQLTLFACHSNKRKAAIMLAVKWMKVIGIVNYVIPWAICALVFEEGGEC